MSNTAYRRTGTTMRGRREAEPANVDTYQDEYEYEDEDEGYYDEYGEEWEEEQPTVLFSTPARAATLIGLLVLVLAVFASVIWIVTSRSSAQAALNVPTGSTTGGTEVSVITNPNVGQQNVGPYKDSKVPDFEWKDALSGKPLTLGTIGKPIFINFWATWCPPCRAEMPEMQKMYDKYKGQVEFIGISMGPRDDPGGVKTFINQPPNGPPSFPYTWRFVHDTDYAVATRYQIQALPTSFFIDAKGVIQAVQVGAMNASQIEAYLQQIK